MSTIIKAAAVQISPVLYSRQGTVEKVVKKIRELARRKRKLTAAYPICASSRMIPAPDEIGLMSISR